MHLKLGDIDLIKREDKSGAVIEIRSVQSLSLYGRRSIVELSIPGSDGNVFQDMGRNPSVITFEGELIGSKAESTAQSLKEKFELRIPVPFASDIALVRDITSVIIEKFTVHFIGGENLGIRYSLFLKEHKSNKSGAKSQSSKEDKDPPSQAEKSKKDVKEKIDEEFERLEKK
jgi:hypothetical protein